MVTIWTIKMAPGAVWTLPATDPRCHRRLFFFNGTSIESYGQSIAAKSALTLDPSADAELRNGEATAEFLLLQGIPIGEPVAQYGPFVMNTNEEIHEAFADYRATGFGGWPWPDNDPTHPRDASRFARHADGRREEASD